MKSTIIKTGVVCLLMGALSACSDSDSTFSPGIGAEAFSFEPTAGGAVMHYVLPANEDIVGLNVQYKDFSGEKCEVQGSVLADSVILSGFNEAQSDVPAQVRLEKRDGSQSAPINVTFSTSSSGPVTFVDSVRVMSGWDGFTVITNVPKEADASGLAHIYYVGTNVFTHQPDTVSLSTFRIRKGTDTLNFVPAEKNVAFDVVIRTENNKGYMVKEKTYPNIAAYVSRLLPRDEFTFEWSKSVEDPDNAIGAEEMLNGNTKGITYFDEAVGTRTHICMAGRYAIGEPMYVDMKKNRVTAGIRIYEPLNIRYGDIYSRLASKYTNPVNGIGGVSDIVQKTPCNVDLYAAKDDGGSGADWDSKEWKLIGSFAQDQRISPYLRWCYGCSTDSYTRSENIYSTREEVENANPIYMSIDVVADGQGDGYRYLKIVVNQCFITSEGLYRPYPNIPLMLPAINRLEYIFIQQLEIYTN